MLKKLLVFLLLTEIFSILFYKDFILNRYQVHFVDIGQGDATFIQAPYGCQMLIDGGKPHTISDQIHRFLPSTKKQIHLMIATHPDLDHYGGLQQIAERYTIQNSFITNHPKTNKPYQLFLQTLASQSSNTRYHSRDTSYEICGLKLHILTLNSTTSNGSSVIAFIQLPNQITLLLAGDIEKEEEQEFIKKYPNLKVNIFKANHHGSKTSNTKAFLRSIQPQIAIVSSKKDNHFGHPHLSVLNNFQELSINLLRTDIHGTISFSF